MHDPLDASTIIFALLAIFIIWKLRSVLGTRTGNERPPINPFLRRTSSNDKVVPLPGAAPPSLPAAQANPWSSYAEPGSRVAAGLDAIAAASPGFAIGTFISGAKTAYETIVTAFASGDRQTLQNLLDKDVYDNFVTAIAARENRRDTMTTKVVSVDQITVDDALMLGRSAQIGLRFHSKLVSATRDKSGGIIEGDLDKVVETINLWTFARDVSSRDPNWKLIATETGH